MSETGYVDKMDAIAELDADIDALRKQRAKLNRDLSEQLDQVADERIRAALGRYRFGHGHPHKSIGMTGLYRWLPEKPPSSDDGRPQPATRWDTVEAFDIAPGVVLVVDPARVRSHQADTFEDEAKEPGQ